LTEQPANDRDAPERIRLLVVDDYTLVREGFVRMLELCPDFEVVGQASSAREALERCRLLQPDVVLMDIRLPEINGIEATRLIKQQWAHIEVIILSMYDEDEYVMEAVKAGATGYLLKDVSREQLFQTIKIVYSGGSMMQPHLARKLLKEFASIARTPGPPERRSGDPPRGLVLSEREVEVLQHVADGLSNKEIADALTISEKTVKAHLRTIFRKLEVGDRAQAVAYAMRRGWVE
jgi:DNA-binding NarL/FixJ family response regulator